MNNEKVEIIRNNRGGFSIKFGSITIGNYPTYEYAEHIAKEYNFYKTK